MGNAGRHTMTDQHRYPENADEAEEFLGGLRFDDSAPAPEIPGADAVVTVSRTVISPVSRNAVD